MGAQLPRIDEHAVTIEAARERVWPILTHVLSRSDRLGAIGARLLGCADLRPEGPPEQAGSVLLGFRVVHSEPPREWALEGEHRFSRYALTFRVDELADGASKVRAETRAEFPGLRGRAYRGLVIGTRGHVVAVQRMLAAVKRRAERV